VRRDEHGIVVAAEPAQRPGYILIRCADRYGRAVVFAFAGQRPDGTGGGYGSSGHVNVDAGLPSSSAMTAPPSHVGRGIRRTGAGLRPWEPASGPRR
jgi:hypothetical protein